MHLDEFQQKVEEAQKALLLNQVYVDTITKHLRQLEALQRMFPTDAGYYTGYISDEFIPDMLVFLAQLAETRSINLNSIATKIVKENEKQEYHPE